MLSLLVGAVQGNFTMRSIEEVTGQGGDSASTGLGELRGAVAYVDVYIDGGRTDDVDASSPSVRIGQGRSSALQSTIQLGEAWRQVPAILAVRSRIRGRTNA